MAEHDDERSPQSDARRVRDDVRDVAESLHRTSNRVHAQEAAIKVLERRADDSQRALEKHEQMHETLRDDIVTGVRDARKYAATLVADFKAEVLRVRREDREVARDERRRSAWRIGMVIAAIELAFRAVDLLAALSHGVKG